MGIWAGVRNMTLVDAVVISSGQMAQLTVRFFTFSLITKRILAHVHDLDGLQSHQVNCTWVMEALGTDDYPEMAIIGEWEHYNIGVTPGCSSDYLKVYDTCAVDRYFLRSYPTADTEIVDKVYDV